MDNIDRRIAAADPLRVDLGTLPEEAGRALAEEIMMQTQDQATTESSFQRGRTRRRLRFSALVAAGVIALSGTAAYAAYEEGMHSGFFGTGGEEVEGHEKLYSDSPEIVGVVEGLTREFPLPPGASYDPLLRRYPTKERTLVQRTSLGQDVSFFAACSWYQYWLDGDAVQRAEAQKTIDAIPTWKYWRFASRENPLERIAAETQSGNYTSLRQFLNANC